MNKAFIREPDDTGQAHCPACESLAIAVGRQTWWAHVDQEHQADLAETAFFCPFAKCDVVYFDMFERRVTTDALKHPVYPKDPAAPICGCFGLTRIVCGARKLSGWLKMATPQRRPSTGPPK